MADVFENLETRRDQFIERPLPSSEESERCVLGGILLDAALIAQAAESLAAEDFYSPRHRRIYEAMLALFEAGKAIDPIHIGEELKKQGILESIGGVATIVNLTYGLPHFSDVGDFIKIVQDKKAFRDVIRAGNEIVGRGLAEEEDIESYLDFAEQTIFSACEMPSDSKPEEAGVLAFENATRRAEMQRSGVEFTGLTYGLKDVDQATGGAKPGNLIIIAGRPSMGKSGIALGIADAAADTGAVVGYFSLESPKDEVTDRLKCGRAKVDLFRYSSGYCNGEEWNKIAKAVQEMQGRKLFIDDTPDLTPMQMLAKARKIYAANKRLDLIIVDYLQYMSSSKRTDSTYDRVSAISRDLKKIARIMKVPVIALSQLSRACESRNPPRPMLSDLLESGKIEADADVVAFLYREEYYKQTDENAGIAEFIIAKNRNGPTRTINLAFLKQYTRFENYYGG